MPEECRTPHKAAIAEKSYSLSSEQEFLNKLTNQNPREQPTRHLVTDSEGKLLEKS